MVGLLTVIFIDGYAGSLVAFSSSNGNPRVSLVEIVCVRRWDKLLALLILLNEALSLLLGVGVCLHFFEYSLLEGLLCVIGNRRYFWHLLWCSLEGRNANCLGNLPVELGR